MERRRNIFLWFKLCYLLLTGPSFVTTCCCPALEKKVLASVGSSLFFANACTIGLNGNTFIDYYINVFLKQCLVFFSIAGLRGGSGLLAVGPGVSWDFFLSCRFWCVVGCSLA